MIANMTIRRPWAIVGLVAIAGLALALFGVLGLAQADDAGLEDHCTGDAGETHMGVSPNIILEVVGTRDPNNIDCSGSPRPVIIDGGKRNDVLNGSQFSDDLNGGRGDDYLKGG